MAAYDRNILLTVLDGVNDAALLSQANALRAKSDASGIPFAASTVRFDAVAGSFDASGLPALRAVMAETTPQSRLYLLGHGDWKGCTLGGAGPAAMASLLATAGLPEVRMLSIVADELGRDTNTSDAERISDRADSFAAQLHRLLKETHRIQTTVQARVYRMVVSDGSATLGRKLTANANDEFEATGAGHHRPQSKLRFSWENEIQIRVWAY